MYLLVLPKHLSPSCSPSLQSCSPITQLSERLLAALPSWRKLSGPNQLTSWQQFVNDVQEQINPLVSQDHLRTLAMQLHSMGEVGVHVSKLTFRSLLVSSSKYQLIVSTKHVHKGALLIRVKGKPPKIQFHLVFYSHSSSA